MKQESRELARRYLGKGIRKKRFRRASVWKVKNRILYGLMFTEDIKVSDLADMIGVSNRTVQAWIYEGRKPSEENISKAAEILKVSPHVLFMEV